MNKRILIVDDSEIDRQILSNILSKDFEVTEADGGFMALEKMLDHEQSFDAVLLDISMPVLDGFSVMKIMQEKGLDSLPVILITAEATKENVLKASGYNVMGFIGKPFEAKMILKRIKELFSMPKEPKAPKVQEEEDWMNNQEASLIYASSLAELFQSYLKNHGRGDDAYARQEKLMMILLKTNRAMGMSFEPDEKQMVLIAKAAYLHDMGQMAIPDAILMKSQRTPEEEKIYWMHTELGAKMAQLNASPGCQFFVNVCSEFCKKHHNTSTGKKYMGRMRGKGVPFYTKLCVLSERFDQMFSKRPEFEHHQFVFVLNELMIETDFMDEDIRGLFYACEQEILSYYIRCYGKKVM